MAEEKEIRQKLIDGSLKKYRLHVYIVLSLFFVLNILHLVIGTRYLIFKGSYLNVPVPHLREIFAILIPFYFVGAWAIARYKGGDKVIKEFMLFDPADTGKAFRDRLLAYPVILELGAFTGLFDLIHTSHWELFAIGEALALLSLMITMLNVSSIKSIADMLYSGIPKDLFDMKESNIGGDK